MRVCIYLCAYESNKIHVERILLAHFALAIVFLGELLSLL